MARVTAVKEGDGGRAIPPSALAHASNTCFKPGRGGFDEDEDDTGGEDGGGVCVGEISNGLEVWGLRVA